MACNNRGKLTLVSPKSTLAETSNQSRPVEDTETEKFEAFRMTLPSANTCQPSAVNCLITAGICFGASRKLCALASMAASWFDSEVKELLM